MRLIFVYNADSGMVNNVLDIAHKIIMPETYACSLCQLTHGNFKEKKAWAAFKQQTQVPLEFYHKDEFKNIFKSKFLPNYSFPIILLAVGEQLEVFMTTTMLNDCKTLEQLIAQIQERLKALV